MANFNLYEWNNTAADESDDESVFSEPGLERETSSNVDLIDGDEFANFIQSEFDEDEEPKLGRPTVLLMY